MHHKSIKNVHGKGTGSSPELQIHVPNCLHALPIWTSNRLLKPNMATAKCLILPQPPNLLPVW